MEEIPAEIIPFRNLKRALEKSFRISEFLKLCIFFCRSEEEKRKREKRKREKKEREEKKEKKKKLCILGFRVLS